MTYPVVAGVPILINERRSPFRIADYLPQTNPSTGSRLIHLLAAGVDALPSLSRNVGSRENFHALAALMRDRGPRAGHTNRFRILVVGGASVGVGSQGLLEEPDVDVIETDIVRTARTQIVCDAHDLPFATGAFDVVICQAVLEHVLDPVRVVSEIHRVLADDGLVYSEIPFMQQVHGGRYDVTRFTLLGHRRLYRCFDEVRSGAQGGPGMALAWSLWYFMRALAPGRIGRGLAVVLARILFFWLKYIDDFIVEKPAAIDAASGTFFMGRRRIDAVNDAEILASYRGAGASAT
ncbi:MAG: class I SAM-dependent methyltransferase [Solirubrobacteraceae bacterium]